MTKHIVMFKFRDDVAAEVRLAAREAFKKGIEALPATIPFIRKVHVGFNINENESGISAWIQLSIIWRMLRRTAYTPHTRLLL